MVFVKSRGIFNCFQLSCSQIFQITVFSNREPLAQEATHFESAFQNLGIACGGPADRGAWLRGLLPGLWPGPGFRQLPPAPL